MPEKHEMTVREAGKKGGEACRDKHDPSFYSEIGKKGGIAAKTKYGLKDYFESEGLSL